MMIKSCLETFQERLAELRYYLEGIKLASKLLEVGTAELAGCEPLLKYQQHTLQHRLNKSRFEYNSVIVSLYGCFEQFVETLIEFYISDLNKIVPNYDELPKSITKNHIELSIELLKNLEKMPKYQDIVTEAQIITNLHSCITVTRNYQVNKEAYSYHLANLRHNEVEKLFNRVGVEKIPNRMLECPDFVKCLQNEQLPLKVGAAWSILNELVTRRNQVAHGGVSSDLLSRDELLNYLSWFEEYGKALYEVVYSEELGYVVKYQGGIELGKPIKVYPQLKVVGISIKNIQVKVGDLLVAQTANEFLPYLAGEIEEIQENEVSHPEITASDISRDIAMRISFKAKENQTFFLIPKKPLKNQHSSSGK